MSAAINYSTQYKHDVYIPERPKATRFSQLSSKQIGKLKETISSVATSTFAQNRQSAFKTVIKSSTSSSSSQSPTDSHHF